MFWDSNQVLYDSKTWDFLLDHAVVWGFVWAFAGVPVCLYMCAETYCIFDSS